MSQPNISRRHTAAKLWPLAIILHLIAACTDLELEPDASVVPARQDAGECTTDDDCSSGACADNKCVECGDTRPCSGAHELCVDDSCIVQSYCGDGKIDSGEECDPQASGQNVWTCSPDCRRTASYSWCGGNATNEQGQMQGIGCTTGETCFGGVCSGRCNFTADCPRAPKRTALCGTAYKQCVLYDCTATSDCAPGLVCVPQSKGGGVCLACDDKHPCPSGTVCKLASPGDSYRKCLP